MQGRKGGEKYLMLSLFEVDMMRKGKETKHILKKINKAFILNFHFFLSQCFFFLDVDPSF